MNVSFKMQKYYKSRVLCTKDINYWSFHNSNQMINITTMMTNINKVVMTTQTVIFPWNSSSCFVPTHSHPRSLETDDLSFASLGDTIHNTLFCKHTFE